MYRENHGENYKFVYRENHEENNRKNYMDNYRGNYSENYGGGEIFPCKIFSCIVCKHSQLKTCI